MDSFKGFFQSKTIWGAVIALISGVLPPLAQVFGWNFGADDAKVVVDSLQALGVAIGSLLAIYGRVVANSKIG